MLAMRRGFQILLATGTVCRGPTGPVPLRPGLLGLVLLAPAVLALAGCTPDYSANTYNASAVQQANKAEQGVIVGVRQVDVRAGGTVGAVTGAAAGGIAGSTIGTGSTSSAFGALGGGLLGGLIGTGVEHATGDTRAWEYVVRKPGGDLVSVTQKDDPPMAVGERVLVIAGSQARIVADYTVKLPDTTARPAELFKDTAPPKDAAPTDAVSAKEAPPKDTGAAEPPRAAEAPPSASSLIPTSLVPKSLLPAGAAKAADAAEKAATTPLAQ
jgi:outer membrane lipoprotein SlyB